MEPSQRLPELFGRYVRNEATSDEARELAVLLAQADAEGLLSGPMRGLWEQLKLRSAEYPVDWDGMFRRMNQWEEDLLTLQQRKEGAFLHPAGLRVGQDVAEGYGNYGKRRTIGINGIKEDDGEERWTGVWFMRVIVICLLVMAAAAAYFSIKMAEGKAAEHRVMKVVK